MILEAKNISKSFRNGLKELKVLNNLDFAVSRGEIITIMGPSGAGKSTLLNILGTLDAPDSGSIEIYGRQVQGLTDPELAEIRNRHLGFVFQFHHLLPEFTALENILVPARILGKKTNADNRAAELLDYVGLGDRKDHFPSELSGGERLRVAVLRALINQPDLVLADEPTGNLDIKNAQLLVSLFQKINTDFEQTLVVTTHNPEVAGIGQRRFILENGTLEQLGF